MQRILVDCASCGQKSDLASFQAGTCSRCRAPLSRGVSEHQKAQVLATPSETTATSKRASDQDLSAEIERAHADPAKHLGRFLVLSQLGKGGMGVVYRAWDDRLRRLVALKTILAQATPHAIKRFQREAQAVARLRHPSIVSVYEAGELDGHCYLAMELVSGKTLEDRLRPVLGAEDETVEVAPSGTWRPGKIALNKALEAMRDVARAVHYAHEQGVIHRDLKPLNIMIDERDQAHVLDFGIAFVEDAGTKITKTGARLGTLAYMAPEQADSAEKADRRSDIYSLGATLYDVLANRPPFVGETALKVLAALASQEPEPPGSINPRAKGDLEVVCLKCLEKDPARRYETAGALADDLERYLAGEPIEARPVAPHVRLFRRAKRNKLQAALAGMATLAVVAAATLGVVALGAARAERERLIAGARADALALGKAFRDSFSKAKAPEGETLDQKQRRLEPLLGLALRARDATGKLATLVPEDADARKRAFEGAIALGDLAREAGQWSLAVSAFESARDLHVDEALAKKGLERVEAERTALEKEHREAVAAVIAAARAGKAKLDEDYGGTEGAFLNLLRYPEPQTVEQLAHVLDEVSAELEEAVRDVYRSANTGDSPIEGLEAAVRAWTPPRQVTQGPLARAKERVLLRERLRGTVEKPRSFEAILIEAQAKRVGDPRADLARIACEALGWIGIAEGAVSALWRYLAAEQDDARRIAAGIALAQLARAGGREGEHALKLVEAAIDGTGGWSANFGRQVERFYRRTKASQDEAVPRTMTEFFDRGRSKQARGDIEGAIQDYTRAIELDPRMAVAYNNRGIARQARKDLEGAIQDCTKALELDPHMAGACVNRGLARQAQGDLDGAIQDFGKAIELDPLMAAAYTGRGFARCTRGDLDGAIQDHTKAIELDPLMAQAYDNRGFARRALGDLEAAIADCTKAIELDPRLASAYNNRGHAREIRGDHEGAIQDFGKAIELEPRMAAAYTNRGSARQIRGDLEGAIHDYGKAIELDPRMAAAYSNRGLARHAQGDLEAAIQDFGKAIELDPRYAMAYGNRGVARLAKGDKDGAVKDLERFLELAPQDPHAPAARAKLAEIRGR